MTPWFRYWHDWVNNNNWLVQLSIIFFLMVVTSIWLALLHRRLRPYVKQSESIVLKSFFNSVFRPLFYSVLIVGLTYALDLWAISVNAHDKFPLLHITEPLRVLGVAVCVLWFGYFFVVDIEHHLLTSSAHRHHFDHAAVRAFAKFARLLLIITLLVMVLQSFGIKLSMLLAFGGMGGLALGFAAKDTLANFFGGLMLYFDRPFTVGDWIRSPDCKIEGIVETIGWRLCRIRTFDQRPLYVPNSLFSTISVENATRMLNSRIKTKFGLRYKDIKRLPQVLERIRTMLKQHPEIESATRNLVVNFIGFGESSLDIEIYAYAKTTDWVRFQQVREDVLLNIAEVVEEAGAEMAFPTTTVDLPDPIALETSIPMT